MNNGQGLVEYALVLVLVAIVVIAILSIFGSGVASEGAVVCPDRTYTGEVNVHRYSDQYLITTESGQEIRAPKAVCVFEEK